MTRSTARSSRSPGFALHCFGVLYPLVFLAAAVTTMVPGPTHSWVPSALFFLGAAMSLWLVREKRQRTRNTPDAGEWTSD